jgi:hypothetical protein
MPFVGAHELTSFFERLQSIRSAVGSRRTLKRDGQSARFLLPP